MQKTKTSAQIVILGFSNNPERYSYKAGQRLVAAGYSDVVGVNPTKPVVNGIRSVASLAEVPTPIDTITVYVGSKIMEGMIDQVLAAKPRRIILNPGAENPQLAARAIAAGIQVEEACTLVLLASEQF
jgi:predicted CoA-binding protein